VNARETTPIPPHLGSEFLVWLWYTSEQLQGRFTLPEPVGTVDVWVDDRLAFRPPGDAKITAVLTGENPSTTLEARAALAGGKVLQDLRIGMRRDDREFSATLRGAALDVAALKLPQVTSEGEDAAIFDRMFLYEEFILVLRALFDQFAKARVGRDWSGTVLPEMRRWLGAEG
jgi:hypothetical protein